MVKAALARLASARYLRTGFEGIERLHASDRPLRDTRVLDLVTIAFNNPTVISEQIRLLRKHLEDEFIYTVADQSPDLGSSHEIRQMCADAGVPYLRLPRESRPKPDPSVSHGRALNWVLANYLRPRGADYIGFIDHDVFPLRPTTVIRRLERSPVWGWVQQRDERWYLWPGLSFFDARRVPTERMDFLPGPGMDTGGRNWDPLYSKLDLDTVDPPSRTLKRLREGDAGAQSDHYEVLGDWLHTYNASHWMPVIDRDDLVTELLRQL